nr:hypothetical protein [Mycobacterium sp. UM_Kg1]
MTITTGSTQQPRIHTREPGDTITTITAGTSRAEQPPQRRITTDTTGTTATTSGYRIPTITTIATPTKPRKQARGATIATITRPPTIPTIATIAAEQTTLTTSTTVITDTGAVRIPTRATIAINPATGTAVRVVRRAISTVTERHQPIDLRPVKRRRRRPRQTKVERPHRTEIQIRQNRIPHPIPGTRIRPGIKNPIPTRRIKHHTPRRGIPPINTQIRNRRPQLIPQQLRQHILKIRPRRNRTQRRHPKRQKRPHHRTRTHHPTTTTTNTTATVTSHDTDPLSLHKRWQRLVWLRRVVARGGQSTFLVIMLNFSAKVDLFGL